MSDNLSDLIKKCGDEFHSLQVLIMGPKWLAIAWIREGERETREGTGNTPEEAVENLYNNLQK